MAAEPRNPRALRPPGPAPAPTVPARRVAPSAVAPARPAVPAWRVLRWPALVTLAVTLLRLAGELRHGSPPWFSPLPGGGLARVGIVWLVPLVGLYCGFVLQRRGLRPDSPWVAALTPVVVLALAPALPWAVNRVRETSWPLHLLVWGLTSVFVAALAWAAWPALGRLLLVYAALARVPVALVMLAAMWRGWGTHYDAVPPGFPPMPLVERWLLLGLLPQATIWVALTVAVGAVFGVLGWLLAPRLARSWLRDAAGPSSAP